MKIELLNVLNKEEHKLVKGYQVAKNNVIFHEGDVCETIGIIISGKVDIISYSFEGKELLINSLKAGEIFGNNLIFSSEPVYRGDVIAQEKSVIAIINKENLVYLLQNNKDFLNAYLILFKKPFCSSKCISIPYTLCSTPSLSLISG